MTPEVVSAAADVVSAIGVVIGLVVALKQLSTWRKQQTSIKRADVAAEVLVAAHLFDDVLRHVRARYSEVYPRKNESADDAHSRIQSEKNSALFDQLKALHLAGVKCRAVLDNQAVDDAIRELADVRYDILSAPFKIRELQDLNDFPNNYLEIASLRKKVHGSYEEDDELGQRQISALAVIDRELRPIVNHASNARVKQS